MKWEMEELWLRLYEDFHLCGFDHSNPHIIFSPIFLKKLIAAKNPTFY